MGRSERAKSVVKKGINWQQVLIREVAEIVAEAHDKAYKAGFFLGQALAGAELYETEELWETITEKDEPEAERWN